MKVRNLYISPVVFITFPCLSISAADGKFSVFSDQAGEPRAADRVRAIAACFTVYRTFYEQGHLDIHTNHLDTLQWKRCFHSSW